MVPVAHIYAKPDGMFDIATNLTPQGTVQVLLSLVSGIVRQVMPEPEAKPPEAVPDASPQSEA